MARIRTIKPEFFTSEDIVSLSPMARLLYIALWCEADREGRMQWKPVTFKMRYFPADECDIHALCDELKTLGLVVLYEDGALAYIPQFAKHQHLNPRESVSVLTDPHASLTRRSRVVTRHSRDSDAQVGREGKGKEGEDTRQDASAVPAWIPSETWNAYLAVRKAKRAGSQPHALGLIVRDLERFKAAGHDAVAILETSIKSAWVGVFEPKANGTNGSHSAVALTVPSRAAEITSAALAANAMTPEQIASAERARQAAMQRFRRVTA
jgi:hypothetical protein